MKNQTYNLYIAKKAKKTNSNNHAIIGGLIIFAIIGCAMINDILHLI